MLTSRRALAVVALALVVAVTGVAAWLGARERVELSAQGYALSGGFVRTDEVELDERSLYGIPAGTDSVIAVDAGSGTAVAMSFWRNDGPVAVTLVTPPTDNGYDPWPVDLVPGTVSARTPLDDAALRAGVTRLSVEPGETVGVRFTLHDPCLPVDLPMGPTTAVLEATALGITRTVALPLDPVPLMMSTTEPPDTCG
ncbi:hypothetical protein [Actinotalea sp. Marseille-Q4924]|uniref:hypothetical protein n=1 Tax=Actinotalea sp. Marseille-Q4924 TaxID=2866571 RepID=UPI001CE46917|nr:hypothetical protein [Actinotalea sp. Marseille-Q4924]